MSETEEPARKDMRQHPLTERATDAETDTTQLILDAATALIDELGESGLRISDVVERSGCSVGTIYHHFGSRTRLVESVRSLRFDAGTTEPTLSPAMVSLVDALTAASGPGDLTAPVTEFVRQVSGADMLDDLWRTVDLIGLAYSKPGVREVVAGSLRNQTEAYAAMFSMLQDKGWADRSLDPWAVAVFVQSFMVGRIVGLIDGTDNLTVDSWTDVVMRFVSAVLTDDQTTDEVDGEER
jgi:AcrR family transcriptional regulator